MDMKLVKETELEFRRELESGLDHAEYYDVELNFLLQTIKQQQEQLEQRKETLEFYADPKTYKVNVTDQWEPRTPIDEDAGNKARKALEQS